MFCVGPFESEDCINTAELFDRELLQSSLLTSQEPLSYENEIMRNVFCIIFVLLRFFYYKLSQNYMSYFKWLYTQTRFPHSKIAPSAQEILHISGLTSQEPV